MISKKVNVYLLDESGKEINQWTNLRNVETTYNSDKIRHFFMKTRNGAKLLLMPAINNTVIVETVEDEER